LNVARHGVAGASIQKKSCLNFINQIMELGSMRHSSRLQFLYRGLFVTVFSLLAAHAAHAEYPDRPIKYVLSAGAGSGPDVLMRMLLQDVGNRLGTQFVIENRPGAAGTIGMEAVANAQPDGYTLGHGNVQTMAISPELSKPARAVAGRVQPIVQIGYTPNLLSVSSSLPIKSVRELLAYAKVKPGRMTYASAGNGTSSHVGAELFKKLTGSFIVHVPYKTASGALNDVAAGQVDMLFDNLAGSLVMAKSGKVRPLAVTGPKRSSLMPEIPTVSEAGVPGYEVIAWSGVIAPSGLPEAVSKKINDAFNQSLKEPVVVRKMQELGYEPAGGTAIQFVGWIAKERSKWGEVIKASGATLD
jgi:tripartite-type tricarboxylate transporter receptor subunit TctC